MDLVNADGLVDELPPCPEIPPQGSEQFPNNTELLASYGVSGIDRPLQSGGEGAGTAMAGRQPPDIVKVYWTRCVAGETTTTTIAPTATTEASKPSAVSTITPEVLRPSATVDRHTAAPATENAGG
ncbi:hypothetical protein [Nocardia thraciensis]